MEDRPMPNAALRTLLEAIEEVMGENGLKAVLNSAGLQRFIGNFPPNDVELDSTFSDYGALEDAVEQFYGPRGARAMLMRIGRLTFRYGLEEQPAILGLAGVALKALPTGPRIKMILGRVANAATEKVNQPAHIEETDDAYLFVAEECACRWRTTRDKPSCFVTVGALQEAVRWATDRNFRVEQISSIGMGGDACRYRIDKTPLPD